MAFFALLCVATLVRTFTCRVACTQPTFAHTCTHLHTFAHSPFHTNTHTHTQIRSTHTCNTHTYTLTSQQTNRHERHILFSSNSQALIHTSITHTYIHACSKRPGKFSAFLKPSHFLSNNAPIFCSISAKLTFENLEHNFTIKHLSSASISLNQTHRQIP